MKNLLVSTICILFFSCKKENIVNPSSIEEAKKCRKYVKNLSECNVAFIKEYVGDNSIITINDKNYVIEEVYLTYMIDHDTIFNSAKNLLFKTVNLKTKELDCPADYTKFLIIANKRRYNLGVDSRKLRSEIPADTKYFELVYFDKKIKKSIFFTEK